MGGGTEDFGAPRIRTGSGWNVVVSYRGLVSGSFRGLGPQQEGPWKHRVSHSYNTRTLGTSVTQLFKSHGTQRPSPGLDFRQEGLRLQLLGADAGKGVVQLLNRRPPWFH